MPFPAETAKGTRAGVEPGATGWQVDVSESIGRLDDFALDQWAYDRYTSSGLTYGHRGGVIVSGGAYALIAAGTVALTNNTINYVHRDAAGAVTVSTVGFDAAKTPMAKVTTQSGEITALEDWRPVFPAAGGGGGGVAGTGTAGKLPKWTAAATLGDSIIAEAAGIITITGGLTVTGALTFAANAVAWAAVSKAGSSLADLATRSASDLSSGTLPDGRLTGIYSGVTGLGTQAAHLLFTDNTYDIGASGATRPRTGYFATSLVVGSPGVVSGIFSGGAATRYIRFTDAPGHLIKLELQGDGATSGMANGFQINGYDSYAGSYNNDLVRSPRMAMRRHDGTIATPTNTKSGMVIFHFVAGGHNGTDINSPGTLTCHALEDFTGSAAGVRWLIRGAAIGSASAVDVVGIEAGVGLTMRQAADAHVTWVTDGGGSIGASGTARPDKVFAKTGFYGALLDSNAADLVLKRNAVTILTLAAARATFALPAALKGYTVAALPAGAVGDLAYATDLLAPAFLAVAAGGGAAKAPVFYDGTNWVVI